MERVREKISREVDGHCYGAWCVVEEGPLTVSSPILRKKSTQIGGSPPVTLARLLVLEMATERSHFDATRQGDALAVVYSRR